MRAVATINFVNQEYAQLASPTSTYGGTNVSNISKVVEETHSGYKGFQLSATHDAVVSTMNEEYQLYPEEGYQGYISSTISEADGSIIDIINVTLYGSVPPYLYITFDFEANEYAVNLQVTNGQNANKVTITGNTSKVVVIFMDQLNLTESASGIQLTIAVTKWSKGYSSVKITSILAYQNLMFTGKDLISISCSENLLDSQMQVQPGICEQYADVTVYDRQGLLHGYALQGLLSKDHEIVLCAIDDGTGDQTDLGTYIISEWDIDSNSSEVGINCRDKSYLFEKINIERSGIADRTVHELLETLFSQASGMSWIYQDTATETQCKAIKVPDSWYVASDLETMLNKVCALGMLRIYWFVNTFIVGRCF